MLELLFKGEGLKYLDVNNLSDIMDTTGWVYDEVRGWHRPAYIWDTGVTLNLPANVLSKLRGVEAVFTSYYDQPAGCIGVNYLQINRSNGNKLLGTSDPWDYAPSGQVTYRGDVADEYQVVRNVVNERFGLTIPRGVTVSKIAAFSGGFSENGRNYPISLRGMKNFRFWYG